MTEFLDELGLKYFVTDYENSDYYDNGSLLSEDDLKTIWSSYDSVSDKITDLQDDTDEDIPLSEAITAVYSRFRYTRRQQRLVNFAYVDEVELEYATSAEDLSMWWFDSDFEYEGSDYWLPGGYSQIPLHLAKGLDIRYGQAVNGVNYTAAGGVVEVYTTAGAAYTSLSVVVTVPLGVLQNDNISFTPPLSAPIQESIDRLFMGLLDKTFLQFDTAFWSPPAGDTADSRDFIYTLNSGFSRFNLSLYLEVFNLEHYSPGSNLLCVFSSGRAAAVAGGGGGEGLGVSEVMRQLRVVWPSAPDPTAVHATDWLNDPFTYGSYSSLRLGSSPAHRLAFQQTQQGQGQQRLLFAGKHTSVCFPSTAHGAYLSGVDAADRLLLREVADRCPAGAGRGGWWVIIAIVSGVLLLCGVGVAVGVLLFRRKKYAATVTASIPSISSSLPCDNEDDPGCNAELLSHNKH